MQQPDSLTSADVYPKELVDRYAALRLELTRLHSQPSQDWVAIDAIMKKIDGVQIEIKALSGRAGDPQRF